MLGNGRPETFLSRIKALRKLRPKMDTENSSLPGRSSKYVIFFPILIYAWVMSFYPVNMPYWDDYDSVLSFLNNFTSASHNNRLLMLFAQHNEHRIFFDRIVFLLDMLIEGKINFILLDWIGALGLLCTFFLLVESSGIVRYNAILCLPISLACFNLSQWSLVSFSMAAIQQYWEMFLSFGALFILVTRLEWLAAGSAFALATLSSFTGAGGLLVFPVGAIGLLVQRRWLATVVWLFGGAMIFALYFVILSWQPTSIGVKSHAVLLHDPFALIEYSLAFVGNASPGMISALATGIVLTGTFFILAVSILRCESRSDRQERDARKMLPLVLFGLFILATAGAAGTGRLSLGVAEALSSRYAIYGLAMISTVYIMALRAAGPRMRRVIFTGATALTVVLFIRRAKPALNHLEKRMTSMEHLVLYPDQKRAQDILRRSMGRGIFQPTADVFANLAHVSGGIEPLYPSAYNTNVH